MKILYVARERSDAAVAATALHGIAQNVTVSWVSQIDRAASWIQENRDLAALVLEAEVDLQRCTSFLKHVRSLGLRAAVVVIVPEEVAPRLESPQAGAYDYVAKNQSLVRNLPVVVTRAIERAAAADRLAQCQAEFDARLADAVGSRSTIERRLCELEASLHQREQSWAIGQSAAAERQAALEGLVDQERATRADLDQTLAHASAALQDAEQRHRSAMTAAAEQLAESRAQYEAGMARAAATWGIVDEQLREATIEVERARQGQASAEAEVERFSRRESERSLLLAEAAATQRTLAGQLADAETALEAANERAARERITAAEQAAERQTEFQTQLGQEAERRQRAEEQLAHAETAREDAEERHASAMTSAAARLAERQAQFEAELSQVAAALADAAAVRNTLDRQLTDTAIALKDAAAREAELDELIRQERVTRADVEQKLAHVEGVLRDAEQRHASAMTTAATELAERQAQFEAELSQVAAARDSLAHQARDLDAALGRARQDLESHVAGIERRTRREAELTSMLAEATTARSTLESRLAGTETAFKDADERAARERLAATKRAAEREAELDGLIRQERLTRADVEQQLAHVEGVLRDAEQRHASAMTTAATEIAERQARFEAELSQVAVARDSLTRQLSDAEVAVDRARHDHEVVAAEVQRLVRREAELASQLADAAAIRNILDRQLIDTAIALEDADERATLERAVATERQSDVEARLSQEIERRETLESRLAEMQGHVRNLTLERDALHESLGTSDAQSQRANTEHLEEREGLERARLTAEAEVRWLAAEHTKAQNNLEEARRHFQQALDRESSERTQIQGNLMATIQELDITKRRRDVLQAEADRVPQLQKQLNESRAESLRQFEHSPLALCQCTRSGTLVRANRAFALLVDYRNTDELRSADFAKSVFESPDDLFVLIERCLSTQAMQSIETTWKGMNGGRLVVRVSACASASDVIEIVAEDLTSLYALQDRLRQAQRMEAVGRLASEVAVTCGNLLLDVHQDAQQWLMTVGGNTILRHQGEMLLDEVTRAAGFLRQLAAYSDEETSALEPVDLNRVLRDLEPVLKRVAGDDVELELPKASSPIEVDVKVERVERLLVNLAGFGRQRMPSGGRLRIELATVVVDRGFIAKYPNVRQGPHALITVTEVKRAVRAEGLLRLRTRPTQPRSDSVASEKPGVDLGALQELIRECGGHLWMAVEPPGDMVVKMHLPMCASGDRTPPRTSVVRTGRGRTMAAGATDFHH